MLFLSLLNIDLRDVWMCRLCCPCPLLCCRRWKLQCKPCLGTVVVAAAAAAEHFVTVVAAFVALVTPVDTDVDVSPKLLMP